MKTPAATALFATLACAPAALAQTEPSATVTVPVKAELAIPNLHLPRERLLTGGQPEATTWEQLAARGVTTVINLRPRAELGARDEAAEVLAAGLAYREITVAGAHELTEAKARELWTQLEGAQGGVLVHCASGNRVGALLALGAATAGVAPEQALQFGRSAGLTGLEPRVRELLGLPPKD